jgi:hypothetical protein
MELKFWGVRGSVPMPGPNTAKVGGNTICVSLRLRDYIFVFDAGTGIRENRNHGIRPTDSYSYERKTKNSINVLYNYIFLNPVIYISIARLSLPTKQNQRKAWFCSIMAEDLSKLILAMLKMKWI